ncbi:MAG TPA: hypothetical protein VK165_11660 [Azonexus sp.]|nr:hypothetical protein [Azonexus sp.]
MKTWKRAVQDALIVGSFASLTSLAAMVLRSRAENGTPWASVNAPSHWVWGNVALRQDARSLRYTALGLAIHHASAGFWGVIHEKLLCSEQPAKADARLLATATVVTAVAAWVDLRVVPHRLTPGFQRRLSSRSLLAVYGLFGLGLAAGSYLANRHFHAADRPKTAPPR